MAESKKRLEQIRTACACKDCGNICGTFSLKRQIWLKICPDYFEFIRNEKDPCLKHYCLCIYCAEKRLGRKYRRSDFMKVPCNDVIFRFLA